MLRNFSTPLYSRKLLIVSAAVIFISLLLYLSDISSPAANLWEKIPSSSFHLPYWTHVCSQDAEIKALEAKWGKAPLRMGMVNLGSGARIHRFLRKLMAGQPIVSQRYL